MQTNVLYPVTVVVRNTCLTGSVQCVIFLPTRTKPRDVSGNIIRCSKCFTHTRTHLYRWNINAATLNNTACFSQQKEFTYCCSLPGTVYTSMCVYVLSLPPIIQTVSFYTGKADYRSTRVFVLYISRQSVVLCSARLQNGFLLVSRAFNRFVGWLDILVKSSWLIVLNTTILYGAKLLFEISGNNVCHSNMKETLVYLGKKSKFTANTVVHILSFGILIHSWIIFTHETNHIRLS